MVCIAEKMDSHKHLLFSTLITYIQLHSSSCQIRVSKVLAQSIIIYLPSNISFLLNMAARI